MLFVFFFFNYLIQFIDVIPHLNQFEDYAKCCIDQIVFITEQIMKLFETFLEIQCRNDLSKRKLYFKTYENISIQDWKHIHWHQWLQENALKISRTTYKEWCQLMVIYQNFMVPNDMLYVQNNSHPQALQWMKECSELLHGFEEQANVKVMIY